MCFITERRQVQFAARRLCAVLITMAGLSIFGGRVYAVPPAKDLAQKSTEIHWPTGFSPESADVFSHDEVVVHASPSAVWHYLVAAEQWPKWYWRVRNVKILDFDHTLRLGSTFTWDRFWVEHRSRVAECVPNQRLAWYADEPNVHAYHAWLLIPAADGCTVVMEKVYHGATIASYRQQVHWADKSWVDRLKAVAESHPNLSAASQK
jgi:uncharacterized protein YndB with AHSA1/START domain